MLKLRFFLNEPRGNPGKHFLAITPRLGGRYDVNLPEPGPPKKGLKDRLFGS